MTFDRSGQQAPQHSPPGEPPQRLSLRSLLVHPVRRLGSLLLPLLAILVFGSALESGAGRFVVLPLILIVLIALSVMRWLAFTYQVGERHVDIAQGVLGRSTRSIPMDRIRGVDVTASPLHRLLGIAVVRIDAAAGGAGEAQEGELDAVSAREAERLRTALLWRAGQPVEVPGDQDRAASAAPSGGDGQQGSGQEIVQGVEEPAPRQDRQQDEPAARGGPAGQARASQARLARGDQRVLARLRPRWYLYAPLAGAYLFAPLALLGSLVGLLFELTGPAGVLSERQLQQVFERGLQLPLLLLVLLGVLVILALPLLSIVMFSLVNWNFTLWQRNGSLAGERGLFTRRSVTLERDRIRGYELREGLAQRLASAASLRAVVAGLGDAEQRAQLLPIGPRREVWAAADRAVGQFEAPLAGHPPAARTRRLVRAVVPWLVLAGLAELAGLVGLPGLRPLTIASLVLATVGVPLGLDRYRSLGHGADARRLSVRSGSLLRKQVVIENRAVVGWTVKQTWLQRRVGLVTLVAGVGAGGGGYAAVDVGAEEAAQFAARVTPAWARPLVGSGE